MFETKVETPEDVAKRQKLRDDAKKYMELVKADKNDLMKVRLLLNQITMDNYNSMKEKLRGLLFGERKTYEEMADKLIGTEKEELRK